MIILNWSSCHNATFLHSMNTKQNQQVKKSRWEGQSFCANDLDNLDEPVSYNEDSLKIIFLQMIGLVICNRKKLILCKSLGLPSAILEKRIIQYNVSYANDFGHAELQIATFLGKRMVYFDQIFQLNCSQFETSWSVTKDFTPEVVVTCSRFPPLVVKKLPR